MKFKLLFLLLLPVFLFSNGKVVDNDLSSDETMYEANDEQLEHVGLNKDGSDEITYEYDSYDDAELRKRVKKTENSIEEIKGLLKEALNGKSSEWTEHTLEDGTKIRRNAQGDIEVWDPVTQSWVPLNELSKEDRDRILDQMVKENLITEDEMESLKNKADEWTEDTLADGTKIRRNAQGDIEVWDPVTQSWVPLNELSKEDRDRILDQMVKENLITEDEMESLKNKADEWTEDTLADGTKIRRNAQGDIEVWDPVTQSWVPLSELSKEDRDRILDQMVKENLIAEAEKEMIKKGIKYRKTPQGIEVLIADEWVPLDEVDKKTKKIIEDALKNKMQKKDPKSNSNEKIIIDGKSGYIDEEGNYKKYTKEDQDKYGDKKRGDDSKPPYIVDNNTLKDPSLKNIPIEDAVSILGQLQNVQNQNQEKRVFDSVRKSEAVALPIHAQYVTKVDADVLAEEERLKQKDAFSLKTIAFCDLDVQKSIISPDENAEVYCKSEKLGSFVLLVDLKSEIKENIPTVTATARGISFSINGYSNENSYVIKESLILNAYTLNKNIATRVNMRRFEKFFSKTGKDAFELGKAGVDKYTEALSGSLEDTQTTTDGANGDKTVSSNSATPKIMDYMTPVGIQIAMAALGNGLEIIFRDTPEIYEIDKGSKWKVYLTLSKEGQNEEQNGNKVKQ